MSWQGLNNFELQAVRRLLCLDVKEAAELVGKVSARTWQYWESGRSQVPDDVETEMYALTSQRNQVINAVCAELQDKEVGAIRWYHTFEHFAVDFPNGNKVAWRLHQSVCAYLFCEGGEVALNADALLNKDSYLYQWFAGETAEQLEYAKQEKIAREKGLID